MITDIAMDEKKNEPNEELLEKPLRGILRNNHKDIEDKFIRDRVVYICLILLWAFIIAPIVILCSYRFWV
jgi:hypothetical protein